MKIGVLGGSFNPPHIGHRNIAKEACEQFSFDKLLIIPCKNPVHKSALEFASATDRLFFCKKTFDFESCEILDIEIKSERDSYTLYTLQSLKEKYPNDEIFFIIGGDMLFYFRKWYRYKELFTLATFVVFSREQESKDDILKEIESLNGEGGSFIFSKIEETVISSSEIRDDIQKNREFLVPEVYDYIVENSIYKGKRDE